MVLLHSAVDSAVALFRNIFIIPLLHIDCILEILRFEVTRGLGVSADEPSTSLRLSLIKLLLDHVSQAGCVCRVPAPIFAAKKEYMQSCQPANELGKGTL